MNTAAMIFACIINIVQPPLPVAYPVIVKDSHYLSMHRRWGNFNLATKTITFRDGWTGEDMDRFDRVSTAHEFARYAAALKGLPQDKNSIKAIETQCYNAE